MKSEDSEFSGKIPKVNKFIKKTYEKWKLWIFRKNPQSKQIRFARNQNLIMNFNL